MYSVLTVLGARPQFVKASVVSVALRQVGISERIVHTGQHYDFGMSDVFFNELDIPVPAINLGIGGGTHGQNTGRMLEALEQVILETKPDGILVYGDTDTTLAGALAAAKLHVPVAHLEAGLRSHNMRMPEEINRRLTDHISSILFAPTEVAIRNLKHEGISDAVLVGDVMFDVAVHFGPIAERKSTIIERLGLRPGNYVLATIHRAENTDGKDSLSAILSGMDELNNTIVWPLHPRTRKQLETGDLGIPKNVLLIEPVGYLDMVKLEKNALIILTDSGGVQKEAFFHGVQCITLRRETEWTELVDAGWNRLCDPAKDSLVEMIEAALSHTGANVLPYGSGDAAVKVASTLKEGFQ